MSLQRALCCAVVLLSSVNRLVAAAAALLVVVSVALLAAAAFRLHLLPVTLALAALLLRLKSARARVSNFMVRDAGTCVRNKTSNQLLLGWRKSQQQRQ
jgi:hypothetical protein